MTPPVVLRPYVAVVGPGAPPAHVADELEASASDVGRLLAEGGAVLVCGGTFAIVQFAWSNFVGVELVDIAGGLAAIGALVLFCRAWQPRDRWPHLPRDT